MTEVELILNARATLGEGALWDVSEQCLHWVDIEGMKLHRFDPEARSDESWQFEHKIGTVVTRQSGGLMVALSNGFASFDPETSQMTRIMDPESSKPNNRFNDGKCDPVGRFWAGTMSVEGEEKAGSLYVLHPDLTVTIALREVTTSNGIVWSVDHRTMYYIDSPTRRVDAFDYDIGSGHIRNRRGVIEVPPELGYPDGMTIDSEGMLWIAHWEGSAVVRWNPLDGSILRKVDLPVSRVTSCALGGRALKTLYITTASIGIDPEEEPVAGGLFALEVETPGVPAVKFAG